MNLLLSIYISLVLDSTQGPALRPHEADDFLFEIPENHVCYFDSQEPFFSWETEPDSIHFKLYDRWGLLIAESDEPMFTLDEAWLLESKNQYNPTTFFFELDIFNESAQPVRHTGISTFLGFFCSG